MAYPIPADDLVHLVKAHAYKNYSKDGWDFLVECSSDEEILAAIGKATTLRGAIAKVREEFGLALKDEMRQSVRNEEF